MWNKRGAIILKQQGYNYFINDNYTANRLVKFLPNPKYKLSLFGFFDQYKRSRGFCQVDQKSTRENFSLMCASK